jgi:predicted extracellular nuclease
MVRRSLTALVAFAFVLLGMPMGGAQPAAAVSLTVVISQVYGAGGNAGAVFANDYVELFNRGITTVSLSGWTIQYASATGTGNFGSTGTQITSLSGSIAPGQYLLVHESSGGANGAPLPAADVTDSDPIAMAAGAGKVALVNSLTPLGCNGSSTPCTAAALAAIVDLVGYGNANFFEGSGAAGTTSSTLAAFRALDGCTDTDNNAADFATATPAPRNSASPIRSCTADVAPSITATSPIAGASGVALDSNITVTFSEAVYVSAGWFSINCAVSLGHSAVTSGGPTTFTVDPDANFASNESCTVTVFAAGVADQDANDPPNNMTANYTFTFQTADTFTCGAPTTRIHDVQGTGTASPIVGSVVAIEGVVVGDYQLLPSEFGGFYLEEETADADADPLTSEGVFVFDNGFGVAVNAGDVIRARGTVTESAGLTRISSVNAVVVCSTGATVPATPVSLPVANVSDLERFEGMLVHFDQTLTATEVFNLGRFGEVSLSGDGRLYTPTAVTTPGPAANALALQNNRSRIILDDGNNLQNIDPTRYPQGGLSATNTLRVGDTLPSLTGVMDFRFGFYRIQPVGPLSFDHDNPRTAAPDAVGGNLRVATFNVLNFFNGDGLGGGFPTSRGATTLAEFERQRAKEVSALRAINADIVGLSEIENDAPPNSAIEDLVAGLNAAMGVGTYAFIDTGVIGTDAIKVAFIYKPAAVTPVGAFKVITSSVDPRFIDTLNRPSLAQTFQQNASGQKLTLVVNHLKSKSSDCNSVGDPDMGDGQGNCNKTRAAAAAALLSWIATDPTGSGDPDFMLIGDMNSYAFEDPITTFTSGGLTNLVAAFEGADAYSYVFNGESGYLDHALANSSLVAQVTGETHWHINPDEPTVLDYNTEFKTANQVNTFYSPGPYRSSDHDPVIVGVHFNMAPTADAGGPYVVAEGGSTTLSASGTDPESDTLTYAWDLDNNGSFETPGQNVTFSAAGLDGPSTWTVKVRVSDGDQTTVATTTVTVQNVAPTASPGGPYAGVPYGAVIFAGSATDPAGPRDTLTYAWDFEYDGTFAADASGVDLKTPSHAYAAPGTYTVALRVTDDDGGVSSLVTATVIIGAPTTTEGKIEGTPKWGDLIKTKINVNSNDGEIKGRIQIEGAGRNYDSTRLDSIVVVGSDATVYGAFGDVNFRLDVHDGGKDGDTLRLRTTDGYDTGVLTQPRGELTVWPK